VTRFALVVEANKTLARLGVTGLALRRPGRMRAAVSARDTPYPTLAKRRLARTGFFGRPITTRAWIVLGT